MTRQPHRIERRAEHLVALRVRLGAQHLAELVRVRGEHDAAREVPQAVECRRSGMP